MEREQARSRPTIPRPPKVPVGPLEDVSQEGIAVGRRHTVKIGSKRKLKRKTNRKHGQRTAKNKTRK